MDKTCRLIFCTVPVTIFLFIGCASAPKQDPVVFTQNALAATDIKTVGRLEKGSVAEQSAIARFKTFNSDFSAANITNNTKSVYAADVYFRDPFKEIHGEPEFEAYLLRGSDAVSQFSMDWQGVAEN